MSKQSRLPKASQPNGGHLLRLGTAGHQRIRSSSRANPETPRAGERDSAISARSSTRR